MKPDEVELLLKKGARITIDDTAEDDAFVRYKTVYFMEDNKVMVEVIRTVREVSSMEDAKDHLKDTDDKEIQVSTSKSYDSMEDMMVGIYKGDFDPDNKKV